MDYKYLVELVMTNVNMCKDVRKAWRPIFTSTINS